MRPEWRTADKNYTEKDGHKSVDVETVVVSAYDSPIQTMKGIRRNSTGQVAYSARHRLKFEIDAEAVMRILQDVVPHGAKEWAMGPLEQEFFDQNGRLGCWVNYNVPLDVFLSLFPRTFQVFGSQKKFARPVQKSRTHIVDSGEDAMRRLALLRQPGSDFPESGRTSPCSGVTQDTTLPPLQGVRAKAKFVPDKPQASNNGSLVEAATTLKLPPLTTQ